MRVNKDSISQRNCNQHSREAWYSFPLGIQQSKYHWDETRNIKNSFIWKYCAFKWAKQILGEEQLQNTAVLQVYERSRKSKERKTEQKDSISSEPRVLIIKKKNIHQARLLVITQACGRSLLSWIFENIFPFHHFSKYKAPHTKDSNEQMLEKDVNTLLNPHICSTLIAFLVILSLHSFHVVDYCLSTQSLFKNCVCKWKKKNLGSQERTLQHEFLESLLKLRKWNF